MIDEVYIKYNIMSETYDFFFKKKKKKKVSIACLIIFDWILLYILNALSPDDATAGPYEESHE